MPHCTLEYSGNIPIKFEFKNFFSGLHELLSSFETIKIEKIKSRAVKHHDYFLGNGDPQNAFVYLHIAMLDLRDVEFRQRVSKSVFQYLREQFEHATQHLHCSMNVEIREIELATFTAA